jgi:hypothetical protein
MLLFAIRRLSKSPQVQLTVRANEVLIIVAIETVRVVSPVIIWIIIPRLIERFFELSPTIDEEPGMLRLYAAHHHELGSSPTTLATEQRQTAHVATLGILIAREHNPHRKDSLLLLKLAELGAAFAISVPNSVSGQIDNAHIVATIRGPVIKAHPMGACVSDCEAEIVTCLHIHNFGERTANT